MRVLGIESSCDETAAAVVELEGGGGLRVRSSVVASQAGLHAEYGGVVPEIASRAHVERMGPVVARAVGEAGLGLSDVEAVAVGNRPGLIGSLLVGVSAAKALSWSLGVPLVGVDHVQAHLTAGFLDMDGEGGGTGADGKGGLERVFPALGLVVSGGHSSMYRCGGPLEAELLGATIDDAVGEAFDKAATILGLPYPGGPALDALASCEGADDGRFDFPISRMAPGSLDFSFSGLKTAVLYATRGVPRPKREGGGYPRELGAVSEAERRDIAASFQKAACAAVVLKMERALDGLLGGSGGGSGGVRSIVAGGGVTANSRLRRELAGLASRRGLKLVLPRLGFCVDNAAMIAGLGALRLGAGKPADGLGLSASPVGGRG